MLNNCGALSSKANGEEESCEFDLSHYQADVSLELLTRVEDPQVHAPCMRCNYCDQTFTSDRLNCLCSLPHLTEHNRGVRQRNQFPTLYKSMRLENPSIITF